MASGMAEDLNTAKNSPQQAPVQGSTFCLPFIPAPGSALQKWTEESPGTRDIVQESHDAAVRNLKAEFQGKDHILVWLEKVNTMEEVLHQVSELQQRYEEDVKFKKAKMWLHKFSAVVLHYESALNMLAQQTPGYVGLVWGTMRFILTAVMNKEKQLADFAEALVYIGNLLPRAQLNVELYRNEFVKAAVARLYEQILLFFRPAIKWYSSTFRRALVAVFEPFQVLKDTGTRIKACVAAMNEAAMSSMQVDVRQACKFARSSLDILTSERSEQHSYQGWQDGVSAHLSELGQVLKANYETTSKIHDVVYITDRRAGEIQTRVRGIGFRLEFENLKPLTLPTKALAMQRRAIGASQPWVMQKQDTVNLIKNIGDWIKSPESAFLVLETKKGREIAAELVGNILEPKTKHVCWHISNKNSVVTAAEVLSSLVWQLYKLDTHAAISCVNSNLDQTDEKHMAELLSLILVQVRDCYIIVEANKLTMSPAESGQLDKLSSTLESIVEHVSDTGSRVKILLIGNETTMQAVQALATSSSTRPRKVISLRPAAPIPASRRRPGMKTFFQEPGWLSLQNKVPKK